MNGAYTVHYNYNHSQGTKVVQKGAVTMSIWKSVTSGGLNEAQSIVNELCKAAGFQIGQYTETGGTINLVIQQTRKQACFVELVTSHNMQTIIIYSPAAPLPPGDLPPTQFVLDIMAKTNPDPFLRWTVYQSKSGNIILSCSSANSVEFYRAHPDILSYYVKIVSVFADDVEKMTGKDDF